MDKGEQLAVLKEVDEILANVYQEMGTLNELFNAVARYFHNQAVAISKNSDPKYLNEDDQDLYEVYEFASEALMAIGVLASSVKIQIDLHTKVYPTLRRIAETKHDTIQTLANQVRLINNIGVDALGRAESHIYNLDDYAANGNDIQQIPGFIQDELIKKLNMYRASRYHLLLLEYLDAEFTDWKNGNYATGRNMPDMEDVNREFLGFMFANDIIDPNKSKMQILQDVRDFYISIVNGSRREVNGLEVLMLVDEPLMATYQMHAGDRFALTDIMNHCGELTVGPNDFMANEAFASNYMLKHQIDSLIEEEELRVGRDAINCFLLAIICCLPLYVGKWMDIPLGWAVACTVVIIGIIYRRFTKITSNLKAKYGAKKHAIRLYARTLASRMAGSLPKVGTITEIINKSSKAIFGGLLGGFIGLIGGMIFGGVGAPITCILGVLIGVALASPSDETKESDGSDWESLPTGKGTTAKILMALLSIMLIFEIFALFIS